MTETILSQQRYHLLIEPPILGGVHLIQLLKNSPCGLVSEIVEYLLYPKMASVWLQISKCDLDQLLCVFSYLSSATLNPCQVTYSLSSIVSIILPKFWQFVNVRDTGHHGKTPMSLKSFSLLLLCFKNRIIVYEDFTLLAMSALSCVWGYSGSRYLLFEKMLW